MGISKIERMIDSMAEYIEDRKAMFSKNMVKISKDELLDYIDELKLCIPGEVKKANEIIATKNEILDEAKDKAEKIIEEAKAEAEKLINESEIIEEAYTRADEIIDKAEADAVAIKMEANTDAGDIRAGALSYASDMLAEVERIVEHSYDTTKARSENLMDSLRSNLEILRNNRNEIARELSDASDETGIQEEAVISEVEEDMSKPVDAEEEVSGEMSEFTVNVSDEDFEEDAR